MPPAATHLNHNPCKAAELLAVERLAGLCFSRPPNYDRLFLWCRAGRSCTCAALGETRTARAATSAAAPAAAAAEGRTKNREALAAVTRRGTNRVLSRDLTSLLSPGPLALCACLPSLFVSLHCPTAASTPRVPTFPLSLTQLPPAPAACLPPDPCGQHAAQPRCTALLHLHPHYICTCYIPRSSHRGQVGSGLHVRRRGQRGLYIHSSVVQDLVDTGRRGI